MTHLAAATAVRTTFPSFTLTEVISKHGNSVRAHHHAAICCHAALSSAIDTLEFTISWRSLIHTKLSWASHVWSSVLMNIWGKIVLCTTHLWMMVTSTIVLVETWYRVSNIGKCLIINQTFRLGMPFIMVRRNMLVEIGSRNIAHCGIFFRTINLVSMRSLSRAHEIIAAESRPVSCDDPRGWVTHVCILLSADSLSASRWSSLILIDNPATLKALTLSPVRSLIIV